MAKKLSVKSKTKMSTFVKRVYTCADCGTENEVLNSSTPPGGCEDCGLNRLQLTAKMEITSTVTVVQLPLKE